MSGPDTELKSRAGVSRDTSKSLWDFGQMGGVELEFGSSPEIGSRSKVNIISALEMKHTSVGTQIHIDYQ